MAPFVQSHSRRTEGAPHDQHQLAFAPALKGGKLAMTALGSFGATKTFNERYHGSSSSPSHHDYHPLSSSLSSHFISFPTLVVALFISAPRHDFEEAR